MKKNQIDNEVDKRLEKKLLKLLGRTKTIFAIVNDIGQDIEVPFYYSEKKIKNQATIRKNHMDTKYNKYQESILQKFIVKLIKNWVPFWLFANDKNPRHCFICGNYISVPLRVTNAIIIPYKKSESCHEYCWRKYMLPEYVTTTRLTDKSKLICFLKKGKQLEGGIVCRGRFDNNFTSILEHFLKSHSNQDLMFSQEDFKKVRSINCLKPNGQKFARILI